MEWDNAWFVLEEGLMGEENVSLSGDSPSSEENKENEFPEEIPILPLKDNVLFPEIALPWIVTGEPWVKLINDAVLDKKILGVVSLRKEARGEELSPADFYEIGVIGKISRLIKLPDDAVQVLIFGLVKFRIKEWVKWEPYPVAKIEIIKEEETHSDEVEALVRNVVSLFQQVVELAPYLPREAFITALNIKKPSRLANFIASNLNLDVENKIELLSAPDLSTKLTRLSFYLTRELEILQIGSRIQSQVQQEMAKTQREYFLREQLKAIQQELGELDERSSEIKELKEKLESLDLPPEVRKEAEKEIERLSRLSPNSFEYPVIRNYLDWIIELPWKVSTEDNLDIDLARKILDEDHHDLEKVKERILEYLAVYKLKKDIKGPILCFVGPPGVGKTSLGKSIARAMGRKFVRISLGGIRDEAEIRGHRRTYVGALPGRIIQGIRKSGTNNPVFMLDEVDKMGMDFRGDPASALLEVLDPEQNSNFVDHYLGVPFDLSRVMFIATANVLDTIPLPLLDRMEVIFLSGYTDLEKIAIAQRYLIPKQCEQNGLQPQNVIIEADIIQKIIREYTREAGVRNLERNIATIFRKIAKEVAQGVQGPFVVDEEKLREFLGPRRFLDEVMEGKDEIGVATGLAWTESGGEILFVETVVLPGKGSLLLTGNMGEIMQESAKIALSCVRARAGEWNIPPDFYEKNDIHVHVPAGAIPKDGPSAGITMVVSMISALAQIPVRHDVAMTGEITLTGKVLPIGGVKEKVLAAYRAGIRKVILPRENEKDLQEVPEEVKKTMNFSLVENINQVLDLALVKEELVEVKN
ncbi:MAG TPA: endopeptidase La [Candidatus Atribacteria bacterium]|nr:endopeptidase La [Candidatus Atribacteria bacterium]